jgi:hypothetical protein
MTPRVTDQMLAGLLGAVLIAGPYIPMLSTNVRLDFTPAVIQEQQR